MEILVLGATGTLGRAVSASLADRGHFLRAASRRPHSSVAEQVRWVRVELTTGAGLDSAVEGVQAVIDASNTRRLRRSHLDAVLVEGTGRVLAACRRADVHYVGVSIVGIENLRFGYYQAKLRQERLIEGGLAPWSLLRASQFHDLVDELMRAASRLPIMPLPTEVKLQPVDAADVADRLVSVAERVPAGRVPEIGGPRVQTVGELAADWTRVRRQRRVVRVPLPGRTGAAVRAGVLCTPDHATDGRDFAQWLADVPPPA